MARGGKQPTVGDLHYPAGSDIYLPCAGRNQQGRLERARLGVTCRDPASVVEYMVVPCGLRGRFPGIALDALSIPPPSTGVAVRYDAGSAGQRADPHRAGPSRYSAAKFSRIDV